MSRQIHQSADCLQFLCFSSFSYVWESRFFYCVGYLKTFYITSFTNTNNAARLLLTFIYNHSKLEFIVFFIMNLLYSQIHNFYTFICSNVIFLFVVL